MRAYAVYLLARQGIKPSAAVANVEQELSHRYAQTWPTDLAAAYLASTYRLMQRNGDADRIMRKVPWAQQKRDWTDEIYYDPVVHDAQLLYLTARHFPDRLGSVPPGSRKHWRCHQRQQSEFALGGVHSPCARSYSKTAAPKVKLAVVLNGQPQTGISKVAVPPGTTSILFTRDGSVPAYYAVSEGGFDRNPPPTDLNHGLEVIHEFIDEKGNVLTTVKEGQEFMVRLRLRSTNRDFVNQVAVVDLLPGGVSPRRITHPCQTRIFATIASSYLKTLPKTHRPGLTKSEPPTRASSRSRPPSPKACTTARSPA